MSTGIKFLIISLIINYACQPSAKTDSLQKWKNEIRVTEKAFAEMAKSEGIKEAFLFFAAEDAVLERSDVLIKGKNSIAASFGDNSSHSPKVTLTWTPDFVDVSSSGDLGYTYGKYTYTSIDSLGKKQESEGIFHTVWKRQADGKWKYVWD